MASQRVANGGERESTRDTLFEATHAHQGILHPHPQTDICCCEIYVFRSMFPWHLMVLRRKAGVESPAPRVTCDFLPTTPDKKKHTNRTRLPPPYFVTSGVRLKTLFRDKFCVVRIPPTYLWVLAVL